MEMKVREHIKHLWSDTTSIDIAPYGSKFCTTREGDSIKNWMHKMIITRPGRHPEGFWANSLTEFLDISKWPTS